MQSSVHMQMEGMIRDWRKTNPLRTWQMNSDLSQDVLTQILRNRAENVAMLGYWPVSAKQRDVGESCQIDRR